VRRQHPDAEVIVISREYREADCIEALQRGADYLARPFRKHDLLARVRVAELRFFMRQAPPAIAGTGRSSLICSTERYPLTANRSGCRERR
jgi:DNA-binding response OmpR family regulator